MNKICTDIYQSKKFIDFGIDVNTADMRWQNNEFQIGFNDDGIPCWSLSALLELIPAGNILLRDALSKNYKCINIVDSDLYDNPLDAAFEMVCWLKENGKI